MAVGPGCSPQQAPFSGSVLAGRHHGNKGDSISRRRPRDKGFRYSYSESPQQQQELCAMRLSQDDELADAESSLKEASPGLLAFADEMDTTHVKGYEQSPPRPCGAARTPFAEGAAGLPSPIPFPSTGAFGGGGGIHMRHPRQQLPWSHELRLRACSSSSGGGSAAQDSPLAVAPRSGSSSLGSARAPPRRVNTPETERTGVARLLFSPASSAGGGTAWFSRGGRGLGGGGSSGGSADRSSLSLGSVTCGGGGAATPNTAFSSSDDSTEADSETNENDISMNDDACDMSLDDSAAALSLPCYMDACAADSPDAGGGGGGSFTRHPMHPPLCRNLAGGGGAAAAAAATPLASVSAARAHCDTARHHDGRQQQQQQHCMPATPSSHAWRGGGAAAAPQLGDGIFARPAAAAVPPAARPRPLTAEFETPRRQHALAVTPCNAPQASPPPQLRAPFGGALRMPAPSPPPQAQTPHRAAPVAAAGLATPAARHGASAAGAGSTLAAAAAHGDCPPAPERVPVWRQQMAGGGGAPLGRTSSLDECKVLATGVLGGVDDRQDGDSGAGGGANGVDAPQQQQRHQQQVRYAQDFVDLGSVGAGSFAEVRRALCRADGRQYAVKRAAHAFRGRADRARALAEVHALRRVAARSGGGSGGGGVHVVAFVRAWQEAGHLYAQLELCELGSVRAVLDALRARAAAAQSPPPQQQQQQRGGFPEAALWKVAHDVAAALRAIHAAGIVHLDIKPSNLLLSAEGRIKVGDFGVATASTAGGGGGGGGAAALAASAEEGDARYMAPELLASAERLPSADTFSLGITLYELATTLQLPERGELWHALRGGRAPPLPPALSPALRNLVAALMAPSAAQRPSATELLEGQPEIAAVAKGDGAGAAWLVAEARAAQRNESGQAAAAAAAAAGSSFGTPVSTSRLHALYAQQ